MCQLDFCFSADPNTHEEHENLTRQCHKIEKQKFHHLLQLRPLTAHHGNVWHLLYVNKHKTWSFMVEYLWKWSEFLLSA